MEYLEKLIYAIQNDDEIPVNNENLPVWCSRAEEGDTQAQFETGRYFLRQADGWDDAFRYLELAADKNEPQACTLLATLYYQDGNYDSALFLLRVASEMHYPPGQELLAAFTAYGIGMEPNLPLAEHLFEELAKNGSGERKLELAIQYANGTAVPKSRGKAMHWLQFAIKDGVPNARERFDSAVAKESNLPERPANVVDDPKVNMTPPPPVRTRRSSFLVPALCLVLVIGVAVTLLLVFRSRSAASDPEMMGNSTSAVEITPPDQVDVGVESEPVEIPPEEENNPVQIDLFEDISVEYKGTSPFAKADIINESDDSFVKRVKFSVEPSDNLSNGDIITILAQYDTDKAAEVGYEVKEDEQTIIVSGLDRFVMDINELPEDIKQELEQQAQDMAEAKVASTKPASFDKELNDAVPTVTYYWDVKEQLQHAGSYLLSVKQSFSDNKVSNYYISVYKFRAAYHSTRDDYFDGEIYIPITISNIIISDDEELIVDYSNAKTEKSCASIDDVYTKYISTKKDKYTVSQDEAAPTQEYTDFTFESSTASTIEQNS